jgi:hypothetical protein
MTSTALDNARAVLDGRTPVPPGQQARLAAFLGRQALEDVVDSICEKEDRSLHHPVTMRSRLTVLEIVHGPEVARAAEVAWIGLSDACHHHAYELAPTAAEVSHLIDIVATLLPQQEGPTGD